MNFINRLRDIEAGDSLKSFHRIEARLIIQERLSEDSIFRELWKDLENLMEQLILANRKYPVHLTYAGWEIVDSSIRSIISPFKAVLDITLKEQFPDFYDNNLYQALHREAFLSISIAMTKSIKL